MEIFDFYKGFEGEPEIAIFIKKDTFVTHKLLLWSGYFDNIICLINPNQNGFWEGVSLHYHTHTGWYDEAWECENQELFLDQLKSIKTETLSSEENEILSTLITLLVGSIKSKSNIFFEYY